MEQSSKTRHLLFMYLFFLGGGAGEGEGEREPLPWGTSCSEPIFPFVVLRGYLSAGNPRT